MLLFNRGHIFSLTYSAFKVIPIGYMPLYFNSKILVTFIEKTPSPSTDPYLIEPEK